MAWNFAGQNLTKANLSYANLTNANLGQANLTNADLSSSDLTGADVSGADLTGARVSSAKFNDTNLTLAPALLHVRLPIERYTWSGEMGLAHFNLSGANFSNEFFYAANFTGADLDRGQPLQCEPVFRDTQPSESHRAPTFAEHAWMGPSSKGFTVAQFYSTASYQAHDLTRIGLGSNDLTGWNFAGQNLTTRNLFSSILTGADFRQANLASASFSSATLTGAGFHGC